MKRKAFLLTSLGALCAAATGKAAGLLTPKLNGNDKAQVITSGTPKVLVDGREIHGWGVDFIHPRGPDISGNRHERYAICYETKNETRAGFARKLRLLADSIETGHGAVLGSNVLTGHELNRAEYPAEDRAATEAKYPFDYKPSVLKRYAQLSNQDEAELFAYLKDKLSRPTAA